MAKFTFLSQKPSNFPLNISRLDSRNSFQVINNLNFYVKTKLKRNIFRESLKTLSFMDKLLANGRKFIIKLGGHANGIDLTKSTHLFAKISCLKMRNFIENLRFDEICGKRSAIYKFTTVLPGWNKKI